MSSFEKEVKLLRDRNLDQTQFTMHLYDDEATKMCF